MLLRTSRTARLQCGGAPSCILWAVTYKLNISGHMLMWTIFFVPGTRAQSLCEPFSCTLYATSIEKQCLRVCYNGRLISLWLYKENNNLWDWKNIFTYSPLSSAHLWLRCSNFFNPSKKNAFGCAVNRKIGNTKSQRLISAYTWYTELASDLLWNLQVHLYFLMVNVK
jgi:hypothetical protein